MDRVFLVFVTLILSTREIDKVVSLAMFTFQRMLNCNYANVMFVLLKENGSGTCLQVPERNKVCVGGGGGDKANYIWRAEGVMACAEGYGDINSSFYCRSSC